jgi:hypothetical protein
MAMPVVTVAAGGLAVTEVTARGLPVTEGRGIPVTKVLSRGLPVQYGSAGPIGAGPPLDGLAGLTGAYSASRKLLTAYGGAFYTPVASEADPWLDQSGAARNLPATTVTQRPSPAAAGPNGRTMLGFVGNAGGTGDALTGLAISNFISVSTGYVIASFIIDDVVGVSLPVVWADVQQFVGVSYLNGQIVGANWSGGSYKNTATDVIANGQPYVAEWAHSGGNLSFRLNGGLTRTAVSGNTDDLTNLLTVAGGISQLRMCELALFSTVPTQAQRDVLAANFKAYIGA